MNLLPFPRRLRRLSGFYVLPRDPVLRLDPSLPTSEFGALAARFRESFQTIGVEVQVVAAPADHPGKSVDAGLSGEAPEGLDGYSLSVGAAGISMRARTVGGLRAALATFRQLLREYGSRLPKLKIMDWADFAHRGLMLDISRGRVPNLQTLLGLADTLADFKINQLQLYVEHTFAYSRYEDVWGGWGPLTGNDILQLDARCAELGVELVPNQNSFGHLRYWLEHPALKPLAEVAEPYEGAGGTFLRYPSTLAPNNPGTIPFLRELYDELLPHFRSEKFNVGCDETWDLGRGQSEVDCRALGKGRVYLEFLKKIHAELRKRGKQMLFWGDIILHYPELIRNLPEGVTALNWGYEANHPFSKETAAFARSGVPFYVCPGTSTWMSLIGRHDNAFANLRAAAMAGKRNGALGYLNTDWGDGGHPQPLAVSWPLYAAGAAFSWCGSTYEEALLAAVLSRDVYFDPTGRTARAALAMGRAHLKFGFTAPNVTPFGAVIAAPQPETRELFCRDGLKYYARIAGSKISAALAEVQKQRGLLYRSKPTVFEGEMLAAELDMAARMAEESCHIMLWQQALAAGKSGEAAQRAKAGIRRLRELDHDFQAYWPHRNQATTEKSTSFLGWRIADYASAKLHFPPPAAAT